MLRPEILVSPADRMSTYLALEQDTAEMCQMEAQTAIRRVYILLHLFFFFLLRVYTDVMGRRTKSTQGKTSDPIQMRRMTFEYPKV